MLNFCPKCRSFYNDAALRFCLKDGVPLLAVGENENLRREGEDFVSRTERQIRLETLRKQIRKIVSITITTILTILVVSVLTINCWLYFNPETIETAKNEPIRPEPQSSVEIPIAPEPPGEISDETVPANVEPSPEIAGTPKSEPSPTSEISPSPTRIPKIKVTDTPQVPPTKTPIPEITPTSIPVKPSISTPVTPEEICTQPEKSQAISFIKNMYSETWRKEILKQKDPLQDEISSANDLSSNQISVKLNFSQENISVSISPDCQKASVKIYVLWTVQPNAPNVKIRKVPPRRNSVLPYRCEKTDSSWNCN